jgi:predicted amidohydrolase YtcJ
MNKTAIYYNGKILTVDAEDRIAEAMAVCDGRILAVGSNDEILALRKDDTEVTDLGGKCVTPGFIDAHHHIGIQGFNNLSIDCHVPSVKDILELVREEAAKTPKGEWVRGWGLNEAALAEGRAPTRFELDEVSPDNPVILLRVCNHVCVSNSMALAMAGIDDNTPNPEGGEIVHDEQGRANGTLKEKSYNQVLGIALPSKEELLRGMVQTTDRLLTLGITSVHEAGSYGPVQMGALQEGVKSGQIKQRIYAIVFSFVDNDNFVEHFIDSGVCTGIGDEHFRIGPIKLMIDGSSSAPTAAMFEPFVGRPDDRGILCYEPEDVERILIKAHRAGYQITCHAIGDRASTVIVNTIEKALELYPREDARHRVEHCAFTNEDIVARVKKLGIIPSVQPAFLYTFGDGYIKNYGSDRVDRMFPCRTWLENGVMAAGSSDCPVEDANPLFDMYMAVCRTTKSGAEVSQGECINVHQALRMHTYNGAYASFEEKIKGSLEPGKLADFVILSDCPYDVPSEELRNIAVEKTVIGGEVVFSKN